jgi:hypothetical protein
MSEQQMMTDLNGNQVPIPEGATFGAPVPAVTPATSAAATTSADDNMMTDLNGNRVPIPQGATFGSPAVAPPAVTDQQIAQRSDDYKRKAWSDITNNVKQGNLHDAANSFLSLFHNPDEDNPADLLIGAVKGAGQTVNTVSKGLSKIVPSIVRPQDVQALTDMETPTNTAQKTGAGIEGIGEFFLGDEALKGLSLAERAGLLSKVAKLADSHPVLAKIVEHGLNAVRGGAVVTGRQLAHGATPTEALETGATAAGLGTVAGAAAEGLEAAADSPIVGKAKALANEITKGAKVAQPQAEAAVRSGVQASTEAAGTAEESMANNIQNQPLLKGKDTVVDEHLATLKNQEQEAYDKMDEAAGFDVKAERQQLANDQYKLNQLGNTDADVTQRGNLTESINDSEQRIADAEAALKEAGIDPKAADSIHQQRMAGNDFKKMLVKNTTPDGTVNVKGLLNDGKNLRFAKYGDRLAQFFGSPEAADSFMAELADAQKAGQKALTTQKIAKMVGTYVGLPILGSVAGYETYQALKP